ncbi:hypothetical protein MB46_18575 [Arthrobacter alpinus]|nr:hypothetical protein MB46_18575 [Arthrobacter alpinus]
MGIYGQFAKNAEQIIKEISEAAADLAVGEATSKLRGQGAAVGVAIGVVATAAAAISVEVHRRNEAKRTAVSQEHKARMDTAAAKLKALFKKGQIPEAPDAPADPASPDIGEPEGGPGSGSAGEN